MSIEWVGDRPCTGEGFTFASGFNFASVGSTSIGEAPACFYAAFTFVTSSRYKQYATDEEMHMHMQLYVLLLVAMLGY